MLETRPTSLSEAFAALAADMRADARWMVRAHAFNPVERLRALVLLALADLVATLATSSMTRRHRDAASPPRQRPLASYHY